MRRKIKNGKITRKEEDYIRSHTDKTVAELSKDLGIATGKIYYFIRKNNIRVKQAKNSVREYLEELSD